MAYSAEDGKAVVALQPYMPTSGHLPTPTMAAYPWLHPEQGEVTAT